VKMPESFGVVMTPIGSLCGPRAAFHRFTKHRDCAKLRELIEPAAIMSRYLFLVNQVVFRRCMGRVMERYDFLLTPSTSSRPPRARIHGGCLVQVPGASPAFHHKPAFGPEPGRAASVSSWETLSGKGFNHCGPLV
jgi:hypothetical protein